MDSASRETFTRSPGFLRCPKCGGEVVVRRTVLGEGPGTVFLIDCVTGDLHVNVTEQELLGVITEVVMAHVAP